MTYKLIEVKLQTSKSYTSGWPARFQWVKWHAKQTPTEALPALRRPKPYPKHLIRKRVPSNKPPAHKKPSWATDEAHMEQLKQHRLRAKQLKKKHPLRRRRMRRNLTYSQWCRIVYAKHAKHYNLKWPNYKNRSRRIRKRKINRWVRVILGRALKLNRGYDHGSISLNYKNTRLLKHFISKHGKIMTRRQNRLSAMKQRRVKRTIKTARAASVLPYHLSC